MANNSVMLISRFRFLSLIPRINISIYNCSKYFNSTTTEDSNIHSQTANNDEDDIKTSILDAGLEFVSQHGWSRDALAAGAEKIGYPGIAHGMFPNGGAELVHHFYYTSNRALESKLKTSDFRDKIGQNQEQLFLRYAIETKLRMIIPYINKWPQAMAIMMMPQNAPTALSNLMDLVDTIWFFAGDKSFDLSWYGKRIGLATMYKITELCLIQDSSEDYRTTWLFLDRRMLEFINMKNFSYQLQENKELLSDLFLGSMLTIRNVLGLRRMAK
ncbi:ubiquinone biosynthesis protein COQ9, mitochondrial [Centruroides vittatus]|uniref:ubiquinone biosynthesis protein COQ9, mitochondrial n=1 Tax=Centruroides vittatus TaxID=120091 RepID=UPI00350F5519